MLDKVRKPAHVVNKIGECYVRFGTYNPHTSKNQSFHCLLHKPEYMFHPATHFGLLPV